MYWDQALTATINNVILHYQRAGIPTISGRNNIGRVIKTYHDKVFMILMKKNMDRRHVDDPSIIKFKSELD